MKVYVLVLSTLTWYQIRSFVLGLWYHVRGEKIDRYILHCMAACLNIDHLKHRSPIKHFTLLILDKQFLIDPWLGKKNILVLGYLKRTLCPSLQFDAGMFVLPLHGAAVTCSLVSFWNYDIQYLQEEEEAGARYSADLQRQLSKARCPSSILLH
jgi:hypothetical protein